MTTLVDREVRLDASARQCTPVGLGMIWAQSADGIIGTGTGMAWHVPEDLRRFRDLTLGAVVIMGRTTWHSLDPKFRPLPGRINLVLSRTLTDLPGATVVASVREAMELVERSDRPAWVIGGGEVYRAFLPVADHLDVTFIDVVIGQGTRAPEISGWLETSCEPRSGWLRSVGGLRYRSCAYDRAG